jgi:hypothetical protein
MNDPETVSLGGPSAVTFRLVADERMVQIDTSPSTLTLMAYQVDKLIEALQAQRAQMKI